MASKLVIHHFKKDAYPKTTEEAVQQSNLGNWEAVKEDILDIRNQKIPSGAAVVRKEKDETLPLHNHVLGIVGKNYTVVPNSKVFAPFQTFLEAGRVNVISIGELDDGATLFMQSSIVELPNFSVGDDGQDLIEPYFLVSNSHDGSRQFQINVGQTRVVCQNTLAMARSAGHLLKARHTSGIMVKLDSVIEIINETVLQCKNDSETYARMRDKKASIPELEAYLKKLIGSEDPQRRAKGAYEKMLELALKSPGNDANDLNWWSAFNGVTNYLTHYAQPKKPESMLKSGWFGPNATKTEKAMDLALEFAGLAV